MIIRRPLVLGMLGAMVAALAAAGCGAGSSTAEVTAAGTSGASAVIPPMPSGPLEKTQLIVYAPPTTDAAGLYVAQYKGLFKAAGLTVTIKTAPSDEEVINEQALSSMNGTNGIDVTVGNYASYFEAQENYSYMGMQPTTYQAMPGSTSPGIPQFLLSADLYIVAEASVLQPGYAGLYVAPDSGITSIADLSGQKIGINAEHSDAYLMISTFLAENGIRPELESYKTYTFQDMQRALLKHEIPVAYLAEPYATKAEAAGLVKLADLYDGSTQEFPMAGYVVTKAWAKHFPNTLQAFLHALEQGQQLAD